MYISDFSFLGKIKTEWNSMKRPKSLYKAKNKPETYQKVFKIKEVFYLKSAYKKNLWFVYFSDLDERYLKT